MDLSTMLLRVNSGRYPTLQPYIEDVRQIVQTAHQRWQDDPGSLQDISMAHQLLDEVMRAVDAIPTQLKSHCEEIESRGGVDGQRAADLELAWTSATSDARSPPGKNAR